MDVVEGSPTAPGRNPGELPVTRLDDRALRSVLDRHLLWLESDGADGARAELAGASLSGVSLWHADLRRANLDTADLTGANLDHARLGDASLKGASLAHASLWQADLSGADLTAADLGRAKLDHAVLRSSVLRGTGLGGATLWGAHLEGTDLSEAIGLVPSQLEPTSRDGETRLPAAADGIVQAEQVSDVEDDPVVLDEHRGMMERRATEIRRQLAEVEAGPCQQPQTEEGAERQQQLEEASARIGFAKGGQETAPGASIPLGLRTMRPCHRRCRQALLLSGAGSCWSGEGATGRCSGQWAPPGRPRVA